MLLTLLFLTFISDVHCLVVQAFFEYISWPYSITHALLLKDALKALAAAEQAGDAAEIDLQRKRALELGDQKLTLLKQETVLLRRVLALGQLCCHHHLPVCETPRLGTGTVNAVHTQIALTDLQSMSPKILA